MNLTIKASHTNLWKKHKESWQGCTKCPLCYNRNHVVLCRGRIPADVLFMGEAPGESENIIGYPFVGPAGEEFDDIIESIEADYGDFRYALTNTVACAPLEDDQTIREPKKEEMVSCFSRVTSLLRIVEPKLIVFLGRIAAKNRLPLDRYYESISSRKERMPKYLELVHPSAIIRQVPSTAVITRKRFRLTLLTSLQSLNII